MLLSYSHRIQNKVSGCQWRDMKMIRNNFRFEKFADICSPESYDNNVLISMNLSACQLSFTTLVGLQGCTYAILGRLHNFTKIEYA